MGKKVERAWGTRKPLCRQTEARKAFHGISKAVLSLKKEKVSFGSWVRVCYPPPPPNVSALYIYKNVLQLERGSHTFIWSLRFMSKQDNRSSGIFSPSLREPYIHILIYQDLYPISIHPFDSGKRGLCCVVRHVKATGLVRFDALMRDIMSWVQTDDYNSAPRHIYVCHRGESWAVFTLRMLSWLDFDCSFAKWAGTAVILMCSHSYLLKLCVPGSNLCVSSSELRFLRDLFAIGPMLSITFISILPLHCSFFGFSSGEFRFQTATQTAF